jgi:hypothetical protein
MKLLRMNDIVSNKYARGRAVTRSQFRVARAHIGAYYSRFVPTEPVECPCGEPRQTRNHILLECEQYERFRHLLGQRDEDRALNTLLGTDKGIARLAEFIEVTDAFAKVPFM